MKRMAFCVVASLIILAAPAAAQDLLNLQIGELSQVSPFIQLDLQNKLNGKASIKITTKWPTTVCLGQAEDIGVDDAQLVYQATVKSNMKGSAHLEMWVEVAGRSYFARCLDDPVTGNIDWKPIRTVFMLRKGQVANKISLNLVIDGVGTVWIDDVVLKNEPLH